MKQHANTGNTYRRIDDEPRAAWLNLRCTERDLKSWTQAADQAQKSRSQWVIDALREAAEASAAEDATARLRTDQDTMTDQDAT